MGKRTRKTRWRTLPIADEQSDSEESNTTSTQRLPKNYHPKSYLSKSSYSSQSTPRRRYQYDSTRSSSTTSETKITFNEDEYTRITTPRQDVLFKKGYLSKPKSYQTQTSTGNSTTSTGNSTGNGTPDYQSTDLEYESQFVFPNGFVDQNGIYYVNSYEPYPLMVYNPPTYYPEFSNCKSKRYSTGSLTESMSPNIDEASSQDLSQSGGEAPNNFSDFPVYNMVYPGYYINGLCPHQEIVNGHVDSDNRRLKKRRRRKSSKTAVQNNDSTSEYTDEDSSVEEEVAKISKPAQSLSNTSTCTSPNSELSKNENENEQVNSLEEMQQNNCEKDEKNADVCESNQSNEKTEEDNLEICNETNAARYDLKPDAEEFVPRAFRPQEFHLPPGLPFVKLVNVPMHIMPNPAFIPVTYPNVIGYMPPFVNKNNSEEIKINALEEIPKPEQVEEVVETTEQPKESVKIPTKGQIDHNQIVSKLEEAVKEREEHKDVGNKRELSPVKSNNKPYRDTKYRNTPERNYRRSFSNKKVEDTRTHNATIVNQESSPRRERQYPEKLRNNWKQNYSSPKRYQQSVNDNSKMNTSQNYSEMVKREQNATISRQSSLKLESQGSLDKEIDSPKKEHPKTPTNNQKLPNQWISVSSKKKRKNKNVEETEESFVDGCETEEINQDLFESYDVSMLVDVIPPSKLQETARPSEEIKEPSIESILTDIAQNETANLDQNTSDNIPGVEEIEKQLVPENNEEKEPIIEVITTEESISVTVSLEQKVEEEDVKAEVKKPKKKSKKGTQKPLTKRVIITDIDLSQTPESPIKEKDDNPVKITQEEENPIEVKKDEDNPLPKPEVSEEIIHEEKVEVVQTSEKKNKKKKKKQINKSIVSNSLSSSSTTLNAIDDSYDFLLENSAMEESLDKTNIEIYQELDKIIQKGMYNNLETKMKSLNIEKNDDFFKSVISNISTKDLSAEKGTFNKVPDFTKILQSTRKLNTNPVSLADSSSISMDINKLSPSASDGSVPTASDGFFLENPEVDIILQEQTNPKTPNDETDTKNTAKETDDDQPKKLYPITQAVKLWMHETREKTPEVEILKSPSEIFKEFCESDETTEETTSSDAAPLEDNDLEEVVLFSNETNDEFWEDDLISAEKTKTVSAINDIDDTCSDEMPAVQEAEDVLVYESKYGKNEDFLRLKEEVQEKCVSQKVPKHGNLPYRAICCEIM